MRLFELLMKFTSYVPSLKNSPKRLNIADFARMGVRMQSITCSKSNTNQPTCIPKRRIGNRLLISRVDPKYTNHRTEIPTVGNIGMVLEPYPHIHPLRPNKKHKECI